MQLTIVEIDFFYVTMTINKPWGKHVIEINFPIWDLETQITVGASKDALFLLSIFSYATIVAVISYNYGWFHFKFYYILAWEKWNNGF